MVRKPVPPWSRTSGWAARVRTPLDLATVEGLLYFSAEDDIHGRELWVSDGTEDGTYLVREIVPGIGGADLWYHAAEVHGDLLFLADDSVHGYEPWILDLNEVADGDCEQSDRHDRRGQHGGQ